MSPPAGTGIVYILSPGWFNWLYKLISRVVLVYIVATLMVTTTPSEIDDTTNFSLGEGLTALRLYTASAARLLMEYALPDIQNVPSTTRLICSHLKTVLPIYSKVKSNV